MSTITLQNFRVGSDLTVKVRLKDGGVAIDWSTLSGIRAVLYSDAQSSIAGRCDVTVDGEDPTLLVCRYAATKMQYLGVNRIVVSAKYMGETKTYDKPAFTFVRWTADQEGEQITIEDPEVTVEISVEDISSSILQEAVDAAFSAADRANEAAAAAEHMVDIHTGPEGKSAYEVAVEEGYTGTEEEWLASLKGPVGETPNISIGTVTTVEPGTPAEATMTGTPEAPVLNLSIPKGVVGDTPNITVGTVTTGEPGTPVVVTLTGTPEAPVLNVQIPQGAQGNTGSSVAYPFELVNNLTTDDATKALTAAQGKVLDGKISQLEAEAKTNFIQYVGWMSGATGAYTYASANSFIVIPISTSGVKYIVRKGANNVQMAFLKSFDGIPASTFDITGTKLNISTDSVEGMIPTNAKYIYLLRKYGGNLCEIPSITIDGVDITKPIGTEVGNLADNIRESLNSGYKKYSGWMSANDGTYTDTNFTTNLYMVFRIQPGARYSFTKNASNNNHLAFLKSFSGNPESAFDISGQRILLTNATPVTGVVPSDANYLYVLVQYNSTAWGLPSIEINGVDVTNDIEHRIFLLGGYLMDAIDDAIGNEDEHTLLILAEDANACYINSNYTPAIIVPSTVGFRVSNPFYLRAGDKVKVISPAMGFSNGRAVLAKTDSPVFDVDKMKKQAIDITPTGTGYNTTYDYTVTEAGYYIVSWAAQYSSSRAYITFAETDNIKKNTEDIGINAGKISKLEEMSIGPITNVFGDILPKNFRDKFFGSVEDVEVVCVGDSLTGLVDYSGALDATEHQAPGMLYKHWTYQLWDRICLNKPICDRLDSQRDDADVFTKVGTWTEYANNTSGNYGDYSITADTYKSNSADASVSFVLDLGEYEKCNIVFSANPDGALAEIAVTEGNGKLLASLDKTTWAEANGFQVNEGTENLRERHRRVWMKKASGATGEVTVTFKRSSTDTDESRYLYCWGTERWNGASLFLTNLGRGGRNMSILGANRMDIFDRKPDLCIFELPLANETVVGDNTLVSLKVIYHDNLVYLRTLSNDYQDTEFLFVLPTGRTQYFSGNQAVEYVSSGTATMKNHLMAKAIFGYVAQLTKNYRENVGMVNLAEQVYNEGLVRGYTLQGWLASDSLDVPTITRDGVHLNNLGSSFWAKYLSGIFQ